MNTPLFGSITFKRKSIVALLAALIPAALAQGERRTGNRKPSPLAGIKGRDHKTFDVVVEENAEYLRRFIARRVQAKDREDILQETWIKAWQGFPKFEGNSSVRTWLYSICYYTIRDYWRREQTRPVCGDVFQTEDGSPYFPAEFDRVELWEAMRDYWDSCTPDQRELLSMYYAEGLTLPEMSLILKRNLNTVKYQFYRAHEEARQKLLGSAPAESWEWRR